jgi:chromate transport protein ChrA
MADAIDAPRRDDVIRGSVDRAKLRRTSARLRRRRNDMWLAMTALIGALLALPLAQSTWHGPEVAAVLAVSATALFAGQRWAIALIVIAELFLLPTVWPRAFLEGDLASRGVALATLAAIVPGVIAMRRAAAVLVLMTGQRRSQQMCRRVHVGLVAICVMAVVVPLI